ncbi:MAG: hypothetical protein ACI9CZ_000218 [Flavobacterium sp.]|jgi:hypothetical protein
MNYLQIIFLMLSIVFISCMVNKTNIVQTKINIELRQELQTVLLKDQGIRELLSSNLSEEKKA